MGSYEKDLDDLILDGNIIHLNPMSSDPSANLTLNDEVMDPATPIRLVNDVNSGFVFADLDDTKDLPNALIITNIDERVFSPGEMKVSN